MTLNDFKPPKIKGFRKKLAILGCDAHFKSDCVEIAGDIPKQLSHEILKIKRRF